MGFGINNRWLYKNSYKSKTKFSNLQSHVYVHNSSKSIKVPESHQVLKVPSSIERIHHPNGVNVKACTDIITSMQQLTLLSSSYAQVMPSWLTTSFFTPDLERHILGEHGYRDDSSVRHMRTMEDLYLVDFVELQLKTKEGFSKAFEITLSSGLDSYLKKLALPILLQATCIPVH